MAASIGPEWWIYAALALPVANELMGWELNVLFFVGAGIWALLQFQEHFINKDMARRKPPVDLNQPRPLVPRPSYEFDENWQPRKTYTPPAPPPPPQQYPGERR